MYQRIRDMREDRDLPQRALAAEIPVPDGGDLAQAVENAAAGSTLVLQGSCVVGTENGGDAPWVIDKALTIRGGSITVWRGGIVLGDNVTFQNTEINFSSFMRNAIVANGYTLTLDSVTCPTGRSVNLFCGGLLDSNNDNSRFSEAKTVVDVLFGEERHGQE